MSTETERVKNFSWVIPNILAGCALPEVNEVEDLAGRGVKLLVSLQHPGAKVMDACEEQGIRVKLFPIPDFGVPSNSEDFASLIQELVNAVENKITVCVHCHAGVGRTGLVLSCVMGKYLGLEGHKAVAAVKRVRSAVDTSEQMSFINEFLADEK